MQQVGISTKSRVEFQEITTTVAEAVRASGIQSGVCYLFVPHTTAGITVNEHADPSVVDDIEAQLEVMVPQQRSYRHLEGNAPAHIKASLIGSSLALPVDGGRLILGTWQGVFFCEFDGPRQRQLLIKVIPDKL
ncbi:MAG: YjbQ family protein [Dehalococcoidia bacterium]|nr:MAG: YjbQ family protein [Dehalococcoidia bacterium]